MLNVNKAFAINDGILVDTLKEFNSKYNEEEFAIGKMALLSTTPNSNGILFTEELLRKYGETAKGKFVVAYYDGFDVTDHDPNEWIVGYIPENQDFEFIKKDDGNVVMYACVLISKVYANEIVDLFKIDNERSVSVEIDCEFEREGEEQPKSFNILGVTILGKFVDPSCPDAHMKIVRFSKKDFLEKLHTEFKKFMRGDKKMADNKQIEKKDDANMTMSNTVNEDGKIINDTPKAEPKTEPKTEPKAEPTKDDKKTMSDKKCLSDIMTSDFAKQCGLSDDLLTMSGDELAGKITKMSDDIELMSSELEELRKFKSDIQANEIKQKVDDVLKMAEGKVSDEDYNKLKEDGEKVKMEDIETFSNTVKAKMYDYTMMQSSKNDKDVKMMFGTDVEFGDVKEKYEDVWDRLRKGK